MQPSDVYWMLLTCGADYALTINSTRPAVGDSARRNRLIADMPEKCVAVANEVYLKRHSKL